MVDYVDKKIKLSSGQQQKLKRGINNQMETILQINSDNIGKDPGMTLNLTKAQVSKLDKLSSGKSVRIKFSKTQLESMKKHISNSVD